jgi:hypothetical protein
MVENVRVFIKIITMVLWHFCERKVRVYTHSAISRNSCNNMLVVINQTCRLAPVEVLENKSDGIWMESSEGSEK